MLMSLTERMAHFHVSGASVAVIHRRRLEWARGYGIQEDGGPPVTVDTLFCAASISKPVTALAVLRLAHEGKIDLDASVNEYLKTWKIPENEFTAQRPVTVRELLNHTSGIRDEGLGAIFQPSEMPTLLQMLEGQSPARNSAVRVKMIPGTKFEYANAGYLVLQALIVDVTGKSFADAMRNLVLQPLSMSHSTFEAPLPLVEAKNAARAYGGNDTKGMPPERFGQPNQAAAGLWTTPTDLAKVILEIENAYAGRRSRLLTQKTARMMLTPGMGFPILEQGKVFDGDEHWGLGIELGGKPPHPFLDHGGSAVYESFMISYLDGEGLIVMTNRSSGFHIYQELLASTASVYGWPDFRIAEHTLFPIKPEELDKFVGKYGFIQITKAGDNLECEVGGDGRKMPMYASSAIHFFVLDASSEFEFAPSTTGDMASIRFITPTFSLTLPRSK
jgi:CubicO group peptidase (beta-lactamase class C family)